MNYFELSSYHKGYKTFEQAMKRGAEVEALLNSKLKWYVIALPMYQPLTKGEHARLGPRGIRYAVLAIHNDMSDAVRLIGQRNIFITN